MKRNVLILTGIAVLALFISASGQNLLNQPESVVFDAAHERYLVSNWGDGNIDTTDYVPNGTTVNISHTWKKDKTYTIYETDIDENGEESDE